MADKLFTVVEYLSFFAIRHNPSGQEHPMGDGVDSVYEGETALSPGSPGFLEKWQEQIDSDDQSVLMEAYFPDLIGVEFPPKPTINIQMQNFMRDATYNASKRSATNESDIRYGRGVLVGLVSAFLAQGFSFDESWKAVKEHLPDDVEPQCIPDGWK